MMGNFNLVTVWPDRLNADQFILRDRLEEGRGERTALRLDDRVVTFAELDRRASAYAAALDDAGVGSGDRVLIVANDGVEFPAALFGIMRIGAVVVMLNPGLTLDAMGAVVDNSRAAAAVVDTRFRKHFDSSLKTWSPRVVEPLDTETDVHFRTALTSPDDPAIWLFSGGTTGVPKACVQTHKSLVNTTRLYGQGALGLS
jgi:acyl-CoA synthetase (AMP-forming)/AMP-acid ligase II